MQNCSAPLSQSPGRRCSPEEEAKWDPAPSSGVCVCVCAWQGCLFCSKCLCNLCPREEIRETQDTQLRPHRTKPSSTVMATPRPSLAYRHHHCPEQAILLSSRSLLLLRLTLLRPSLHPIRLYPAQKAGPQSAVRLHSETALPAPAQHFSSVPGGFLTNVSVQKDQRVQWDDWMVPCEQVLS